MPYYELGGLQELKHAAHLPPLKNLIKNNINKTLVLLKKKKRQKKWHKWQAQAKMDGEKNIL